ncbi:ABC-F family ATP-binding cassette domain-containing protein [Streptomyces sp. NP160]|uniref:ABC-F family ATP-binding cassette domain-containing protein n=1 Tax=Streptomyces sp. NP160 TaxID=2586637 RepID=UPI0011193153|nr:ATP-binding cassette domain-containing protein [Streptomyces sp. NP160]TNM64110.1 ABC-F family ATP-binding cassette domain-containing protein [Streptomyces sp. NP160]
MSPSQHTPAPAHAAAPPVVVLSDLSFEHPDGTVVLDGLTGTFTEGRTGLVGRNGSGKTTLLRLVAGQLRPTAGAVSTAGQVALLPQRLTLGTGVRVAELLGVADTLDALRELERGDAGAGRATALVERVGDDWDVESRASAVLDALGLPEGALERRVGQLSGGEAVLVALAGLRLRADADPHAVTLLDEPTNSLDREARERLGAVVEGWRGALVVVSHDVALLERMQTTTELHSSRTRSVAGPYSAYRAHLDAEQAAALRAEAAAEQVLRRERRQRAEAEVKLARRERYAASMKEKNRYPPIVANALKGKAEASAGRLRQELDDDVVAAREALQEASARVRDDDAVRIDLPDPHLPAGRRLAVLHGAAAAPPGTGDADEGPGLSAVVLAGPERVALTGPNGAGKTTLLEALVRGAGPGRDERRPWGELLTDRVGYLPQRRDGLDESASALDQVRAAAPGRQEQEVRHALARFLLRGDAAQRRVGDLSGGERFRVALARLLLAEPAHQLLVLDEPTNDLDLATVDQLVDALRSYRGALLVVSHDDAVLDRLDLTRRLRLDRAGRLRDDARPPQASRQA